MSIGCSFLGLGGNAIDQRIKIMSRELNVFPLGVKRILLYFLL